MDLRDIQYRSKHKMLSLRSILIWCFSLWPLFWSFWVCLKVTTDIFTSFPTVVLIVMTLASFSLKPKIKMKEVFFWAFFILAISYSGVRGRRVTALLDIPVILCGFLFCLSQFRHEIDTDIVFRCLFACGLFVSITVLLDASTYFIRTALLPIYSDSARTIVARRSGVVTGGILPYTATAGCFIFSGFGAYIVSVKRDTRKYNRLVLFLFISAMIIIRKRGFILDIAVTAFVIWICGWRFESGFRANLNRQIRTAAVIIAAAMVAVIVYIAVPTLREAVDSLFQKFSSDDETFSGRTTLYALAYRLFRTNPVWGIGWGAFRAQTTGVYSRFSTSTYETHNVYLQLLCETGIVGLTAFLLATGSTLYMAIRRYRDKLKSGVKDKRFYSLRLGLYLQLFFLAYCMSGNPLYDYNFLITYYIGVLLTIPV